MVKILPIIALALLTLPSGAIAACKAAQVSGATAPMAVSGSFNAAILDAAILTETNRVRCVSGLKSLRPMHELRTPALGHSKWMAKKNKLTHNSGAAGLRTMKARINASGVAARYGAENLAFLPLFNLPNRYSVVDRSACKFVSLNGRPLSEHSYNSFAQSVVGMWMKSPGHRRNILGKTSTHMAAAAALRPDRKSCGNVFVTQLFVG